MSASGSVQLLQEYGVPLAPGLSEVELAQAERHYGIRFAPDHLQLLTLALPTGEGWPNWRAQYDQRVRTAVHWPIRSALFDVQHNAFWPASWGHCPTSMVERLAVAERELTRWPQLVPVYGHRYLPAAPHGPGAPVFSVYQTDVAIYGANLHDYLATELGAARRKRFSRADLHADDLEPWIRLAIDEDPR